MGDPRGKDADRLRLTLDPESRLGAKIKVIGVGGGGSNAISRMVALGAWLLPMQTVWLALFTSIAGGVMALIVAISTGYLRTTFRNLGSMLLYWYVAGPRPVPDQTLDRSGSPRLAYAIPIFVGTVITLWRH